MNCSAQSYSTRSTVNGEAVHWEKGEGGSNKTTSSLCERCITGAVCHVKWYEVWAYRLRSPDEGGGDRPRPFIIIAIWAGFVLAENRGNTVTRAHVSSSIGIMHPYWGL